MRGKAAYALEELYAHTHHGCFNSQSIKALRIAGATIISILKFQTDEEVKKQFRLTIARYREMS